MENQPKLTHQQIVAYIHGKIDRESKKYFGKIKEESPVYELLFDLIDKLKQVAIINDKTKIIDDVILPYSVIEEMLIRFLAGEIQEDDAQKFINGLLLSPISYERVINRITLAVKPPKAEVISVQENRIDNVLDKIKFEIFGKRQQIILITILQNYILKYLRRYYIYVVPMVVVVIIISISLNQIVVKENRYEHFIYDGKVPYKYDISNLRSVQDTLKVDPMLKLFINQFELGISDYMLCEYADAIQIFEGIESLALKLQSKSKNEEKLMRDFYFYWGLSYLAFSTDKGISKEVSAQLISKSIELLSRSDSLAAKFNFKESDREIYFMGLAYGLAGHYDSAIVKLKKINLNSKFYNDSKKLTEQWSK